MLTMQKQQSYSCPKLAQRFSDCRKVFLNTDNAENGIYSMQTPFIDMITFYKKTIRFKKETDNN